MNLVVGVCGPSASGKTALAHVLSAELGLPSVNVGDLLYDRLLGEGFVCGHRRDIGVRFFEHFTLDDYIDAVGIRCRESVILDGLRIYAGVEAIAGKHHVVLVARDHPARLDVDPFAADIRKLSDWATIRVPWYPDAQSLAEQARHVARQVRDVTRGREPGPPSAAPAPWSGRPDLPAPVSRRREGP